ncbi:MAG: phosphoribosylanthranilate isomerase [Gemmatimonadota bacterium]
MTIIPPVRVKVSCLRSPEEARRAVSFGAAAIGIASGVPGSTEELDDDQIAAVTASVRDDIGTFLLTALEDPNEIAAKAERCGVNTVQLWEALPPEAYIELRRAAPGLSVAQSIHMGEGNPVERALEMAGVADALVLGSTNPEPPFRWTSPHGRTHDWEASRRIVAAVNVPVILSGGLTRRNVADAVRLVRPYGVEVCSGVRTDGGLDTSLLVQFLESVARVRPS